MTLLTDRTESQFLELVGKKSLKRKFRLYPNMYRNEGYHRCGTSNWCVGWQGERNGLFSKRCEVYWVPVEANLRN